MAVIIQEVIMTHEVRRPHVLFRNIGIYENHVNTCVYYY